MKEFALQNESKKELAKSWNLTLILNISHSESFQKKFSNVDKICNPQEQSYPQRITVWCVDFNLIHKHR